METLNLLEAHMDKEQVPPTTTQLWKELITALCKNRDPILDRIDHRFHSTATAQHELGLIELFRSRFHHQLTATLRVVPPRTSKSPDLCETTAMLLYSQWTKLWTIRNDGQHGNTPETTLAAKIKEATWKLQQLYDDRHTFIPQHQRLFHRSVEEHLRRHPPKTILRFIETHEPIMRTAAQLRIKRIREMNHAITDYFAQTRRPVQNRPRRPQRQTAPPATERTINLRTQSLTAFFPLLPSRPPRNNSRARNQRNAREQENPYRSTRRRQSDQTNSDDNAMTEQIET